MTKELGDVAGIEKTERTPLTSSSLKVSESDLIDQSPTKRLGPPPKDHYNLVYVSFIFLGAGFIFPWACILNAGVFFQDRLKNDDIGFYFTVTYMCPNLLGLVVVVLWGHRVKFAYRIVTGFLIFTGLVVILPLLTSVPVALVVVGVLGCSDAIIQGSVFGLVGQYTPRYVAAVMAGNGWAGILVNMQYILALYIAFYSKSGNPNDLAALIFFTSSAVVLLVCCLCYLVVVAPSKVTAYYMALSEMRAKSIEAAGKTEGDFEIVWTTFKKVWRHALLVAFNFFVTLSLYPALTFAIPSTNPSLNPCPVTGACPAGQGTAPVPFPVWLVFTYCIFDLLGRTIPRWESLTLSFNQIIIPTILRVGFMPLFVLQIKPRLIHNDIAAFAIEAAFALSSGYFSTLIMMYGPEQVDNDKKETAATVMIFFLTVGLTSGVWMGLVIGTYLI